MVCVALLSNPRSTGNVAMLPRIRKFCAQRADIFHYEVEDVSQIGDALQTIARVDPQILVINGGDGTVQATLTELHHGKHFADTPPPVAVLPNGKTNLIALDLGAEGDPIEALKRIMELARSDLTDHIVSRELIALTGGNANGRPVLGMFLGGAGLADSILYCRHKIYPLGLPNGFSHVITAIAVVFSALFRIKARFLPPQTRPISVTLIHQGEIQGKFALLMVTTLERLLLNSQTNLGSTTSGPLKLMMVEQKPLALLRALWASLFGRLEGSQLSGVHLSHSNEIRIEGDRSNVILDGELFEARAEHPIVLTPTLPVPFLSLAA
ncbi:diacylglycerol/lipid kinase family protein [Parasphingopyxis lamellibrachiae]|uniref:Diacylglycerol kinase family enzyme n=1 Tax=Parasphingopyxis lamellibrachiae TaxID=680125 RepID=A0A3D9FFR4_9SPHN|nr:diacylglycerol kinase family protein [Parasphingopyxis lamellibrachiae]RED16377.1 diacylglycerol kinase family enzyme [Parasphingopyxis lamellibrachiae]